jgi:hypothetical protein
MRLKGFRFLALIMVLLQGGCWGGKGVEPVQRESDVLLALGPELRPEKIQLPRYLLFPDTEILRHGRISGSRLTGSELRSLEDLETLRERYCTSLQSRGWSFIREDEGDSWFRCQMGRGTEWLEVRGVQGITNAHLYLLYRK